MKRPKNRLHRVIVIGATPAGIAATNKLGELGIPVTLIDTDPDVDQKLSRREFRLTTGVPFNFAHRGGLIRILRNPLINVILPAEVTSLKHSRQGFRARVKRLQTFINPDLCVLCGRCVEACPVTTPDGLNPFQFNGRRSLPGRPVIDKRRQPLCQANCPLGVNAQAYIALAKVGKFQEALEVVRQDNVLPGICGRVCTHPCEEACRRGDLDEPLAIRNLKRFLADHELSSPVDSNVERISQLEEKIAIIGSGPAGLAAAADFARLGYQVTVFEKEDKAGGLLRYGIGPYRLPREILDYELDAIRRLGVQFITSHPVDLSGELDKLKEDFNAIVLTSGTWADRMLGVPGEDLEGVEGCLSFLNRLYRKEGHNLVSDAGGRGEKVAVVGDGNAAYDVARVLKRLGDDVTLLSWFPEDLIPADKEEMRWAREEGIPLVDRSQVVAFAGKNGKLSHIALKPTEPGEPDDNGIPWPVIVPGSDAFERKFDRAIIAIGQKGPFGGENKSGSGVKSGPQFKVTSMGLIEVDESFSTSIPGAYAAGDAVSGPSSVVMAMAAGRKVVRSVHKKLTGRDVETDHATRPADKDFPEIPTDIPSLVRPTAPEMQPHVRGNNFSEVSTGLSEVQALSEAERCLQCGICSECLVCIDACSLIGAVNHWEKSAETVEHGGAVIIADPLSAPLVKGEDVIRAYGPKAAKSDVNAMIMRGFAAAARAMVLLERTSQGPRGHGVSFTPPDRELSSEIRVGLFTCRCNDAFGWHDGMDEHVARITDQKDIVHGEVMTSACTPEGSAAILRAIREKGITRVVLASCVCCPLDFVCSACTDQRSRLKHAIFTGTGVSRSMVETCNLRGEALRYLSVDPSMALNFFTGLIDRSIHRARNLRPLPSPARTYNFTTAVIGESEAAVNSAMTLAEAGFEVLQLGSSGKPLPEKLSHPNIHCFENSSVKGVSGTLGDFQVFMESASYAQVLQVGAIIIGEKHRRRIPYLPQEGLPSRILGSSMQQRGVSGIPFLDPGETSVAGLFMANPPGIRVSERRKGFAAAVLAAAVMPRGPRQSKGYTVVVDEDRCRGCGSCFEACLYQAISFHRNLVDGWYAVVDEALCTGCGNCISVCPSNAADSPYRDHKYLEQLLEEVER